LLSFVKRPAWVASSLVIEEISTVTRRLTPINSLSATETLVLRSFIHCDVTVAVLQFCLRHAISSRHPTNSPIIGYISLHSVKHSVQLLYKHVICTILGLLGYLIMINDFTRSFIRHINGSNQIKIQTEKN